MLAVLAALCLSFAPATQAQQDPALFRDASADAATTIATFDDAGRQAIVTRGDVALEMAYHQRRKDEGRAGCAQLIKTALVLRAGKRLQITPDRKEVEARWRDLQSQLRAAGRDLEKEPIFRNTSEATWLAYLAVDLTHEQIVRHELGLRPDEQVSPAMLELWVKEAHERAQVEDDPDRLPAGIAARVDDEAIPLLELGMLLLRTSSQDDLDKFLRQVVVLRRLEAMAREHNLDTNRDELERELSLKRTMAQSDPRFRGLPFEQLLAAQGLTIAALLESRVFRGQVLQKKLVAALHPRPALLQELERDRPAALWTFGPRRHLAIVFARALDEPNQLVPRDFTAATEFLQRVRQRLQQEPFDKVARIESDDPLTKPQGGDCGWFARRTKGLPAPVLDAAWQLDKEAISEPVRAADGCYLVKVLAIEPELADDAILERMREQRQEQLTVEILQRAAIARADGSKLEVPGAVAPPEAGK